MSSYKEKRKLEEDKFVSHLLKTGIKSKCESSEGRNTYYCFWLKNGEQRYWVNLSQENRIKVGFKEEV